MNHIELHNKMSTMLEKLYTGQVKKEFAKEFYNGAGKLIGNCKNEIEAVKLGFSISEIPLLEIKKKDIDLMISGNVLKKK